jgi:uncharacterized protein (TIGR02145 family)
MKKTSIFVLIVLLCIVPAFGQKLTIDLTFTAVNKAANVQLDSIKVMNRSQGGESTMYYPDTTLSLEITPGDKLLYIGYSSGFPVGVREINQENPSFRLFQSYPGSGNYQHMVLIYLPEDGNVSMRVNDIQGRIILFKDQLLGKGIHSFRFSPGNSSFYFLSARWNGMTKSIKLINAEPGFGNGCKLDYLGRTGNDHSLKASVFRNDLNIHESGILDAPLANETYTFQFATNIPCPGTPTVEYEGHVYNTIQILSQCWLKENLNVGAMIPATMEPSNNSIIEKYCYCNSIDSCTKYGGLYQWNEMMEHNTFLGVRDICPTGWHVPVDEEWKILEGATDIRYGIGESLWDSVGSRGQDAGTNLRTTGGWKFDGNGTDLFGFSGWPSGYSDSYGGFADIGLAGYLWVASEVGNDNAWFRGLRYGSPGVYRRNDIRKLGFSVRCLRDN